MNSAPHLLLAGWFSVKSDGNTAGDLLALQTVAGWLEDRSVPFTVAVSDIGKYTPLFGFPMVATDTASADDADALVWICGPLLVDYLKPLLEAFMGKPRIALGVSLTDPESEQWFDTVVARDRPEASGIADLSFGTYSQPVPVIGLIYVGPQPEYREQQEEAVRSTVAEALKPIGAAVVDLDTRLPIPENPLQTPSQLESLLARLDLVITTRLHGAVLSLRNGVPAVAIDPVFGGAKLTAQMRALNWPLTVSAEHLDVERLDSLMHRALHEDLTEHLARIRQLPASYLKPYHEALFSCIDTL